MDKINKINRLNIDVQLDIDSLVDSDLRFRECKEKVGDIKRYINPSVYWIDMDIVNIDEDRISLKIGEECLTISSSYLVKGLNNCHKVSLFAGSIGSEISIHGKNCYEEGLLLESVLCDEIGSIAVEMLIDKFYNYIIKNNLKKRIYSSLRFSPGYGDWDLKGQGDIIDIMKISSIINVGSNYMLEPVKSITGIIGYSFYPQNIEYPSGERDKNFCEGIESCSNCITWACKNRL